MRRNFSLSFLKEKSFIIVLTLMLVSARTMAALFAFGGNEPSEGNEMAQQEEIQKEAPKAENKETAQVEEPVEEQAAVISKAAIVENTIDTKEIMPESAAETAELEDQFLEAEELPQEMAEVSGVDVIAEGFSDVPALSLQWPVEGEVIMPFSMDSSIYFKTLAQYQYNPAMMISVPEGTAVLAGAAGTVTDVGKTNEYGHYVTMDLGDGFMITYGQLFEITAEVGEFVEAGEQFAMVAFPTRSFTAEGDNLYLKLTQNDVPVDPELYLE